VDRATPFGSVSLRETGVGTLVFWARFTNARLPDDGGLDGRDMLLWLWLRFTSGCSAGICGFGDRSSSVLRVVTAVRSASSDVDRDVNRGERRVALDVVGVGRSSSASEGGPRPIYSGFEPGDPVCVIRPNGPSFDEAGMGEGRAFRGFGDPGLIDQSQIRGLADGRAGGW